MRTRGGDPVAWRSFSGEMTTRCGRRMHAPVDRTADSPVAERCQTCG